MAQGREREDASTHFTNASLSVRWVQGFPSQNVHFVNDHTICYPSGNYVIFINLETKKKTVLQCINGIVGIVATNVPGEVVAFSDRRLKPIIYIYSFPALSRKNKLKGNILLDYTLLCFSYCGTYLASYSSLPEFELALWNWESSVILCKKSHPGVDVSQMSFNPMNWRQMCLSSSSIVSVWTIERSNQDHHFKMRLVKLPLEDGSLASETDLLFPTSLTKNLIHGPVLPLSAIAGLVGEEAETFRTLFQAVGPPGDQAGMILSEEQINNESKESKEVNGDLIYPKDDIYPLLHPTMHCWTPSSDLYVGCEEGHFLTINTETLKVTVLQKVEEISLLGHTVPGSFKCGQIMCVHVAVISVSNVEDGMIYSFIVKDSKYQVKNFVEVDAPVANLVFSPSYKMLLIQTDKGTVYTYTFGAEPALDKVLEACDGKVQAMDFITPGTKHFLTLTNSGEVAILWIEDCTCASKVLLGTPATTLACSPSSASAVVGTVDGYLYFLDVHNVEAPRVIHRLFLSESPVKILTYDQRGVFLLAGTVEGNIFVIDARPSSSFKIFGYTETNKDILQISTVSLPVSDVVEVLVLSPLPELRSRLEYFVLPTRLSQVPSAISDERGRLMDSFIHKFLYEVEHPLSSAVLGFEGDKVYGFCSQVPYICSYLIPEKGHGIQYIKMSMDGQHILVNGKDDGTLVYLKWKYVWRTGSNAAIKNEVRLFSQKRKEIKRGIKELSRTITGMMEENEKVEPIAKLEEQEFCLDLEELERLHDESEEEVAKIRKDVEMHNLAKSYLTELIREECWNAMAVKGRALKCFHIPYVVENFPMKARTEEELQQLNRVLQQKKTEAECLKLRKEIVEVQSSATMLKKHHDEEDEEEEDEETVEKDTSLPNYMLGSLSTDFGADTSLLTSQLELHSREEKINQIILLKETVSEYTWNEKSLVNILFKSITKVDIIYKVKKAFNSEFDAAYKQKEIEIARVKERNVRIEEIITDLELEEKVWQPVFEDCEKPERALVVEDDEISFQKHLAPWQKSKTEMTTPFEMEQQQQALASDARQRGLMDMMGGVLEVKKEDILRMVIPQPAFMTKPDALWNEEERKQFKEYEKKVKELNEERDKYRKSLETELKKLQNSIQESTQNFDEHLKRLFERRVKAEMVVNQEELKINNLVFSLLLDEELSSREQFLNNYLLKKQEEKNKTAEAIQKARGDLDVFKEHHDNLVAEDKILDRSFKKEFSDISGHQVDILYKLFKRRPRIHKQKTHADVNSLVPYGERPGSGKLNKENFTQLMKAMDELDNISNMPEGLDPFVWEHFCTTRRAKVENEYKVKQKAAGLQEMTTFLRRRVEDDEAVQHEIEKVSQELLRLQEEKVRFQVNLTIQILLKQGQVELENFQLILEYSDAILINKNIIEDLNSVIRAQGQKKVASMMESKEVHKGIYQIEWEHKKMEMEMEDLNQKAWDIQMLFFSRDRQKARLRPPRPRYLNEPNYENLIAIQIGIMEQTINAIDKVIGTSILTSSLVIRKQESYQHLFRMILGVASVLKVLAVTQLIPLSISGLGSKLTCEKIAKERYENLLKKQKLTNISKQQAEQISILQAEVERLRMKTFPALVPM
ncbi:hypothetical protein ACRRTK_011945 [Alexandromys fortis]